MQLLFVFCNIFKQTRDTRDRLIVFLPIKQIGYTLVVSTSDNHGMASAALVIKEGKHIDVHLELILVQ